MKIILIADDLTGALDASVAFAARGMSVLCACTPDAVGRAIYRCPDVVAVSTNSRDLSEARAVECLQTVLERARLASNWHDVVLFKKVDSRLKGHIEAEMSVLLRHRPDALICPAIPRLGRFVRNGAVCGAGVAVPIPVLSRIGGVAAKSLDAERQEDLNVAVAATNLSTLFVGAAGLAEALALHMTPVLSLLNAPEAKAPALLAIGSRDPVTLDQLHGLDPITAPNGVLPVPPPCDNALIRIVQMIPGIEEALTEAAGKNFAEGVRSWLIRHKPSTLLACGGASAAAILRALDCSLVRVEGEILPGLPVSKMVDGIPGMTFITKSGGFGPADTLHEVARKLMVGAG